MKDHNEMTVDECRDELARSEGWSYATSGKYNATHHDGTRYQMHALADDWVYHRDGDHAQRHHPIPATLDEVAKLPEGWYVKVHHVPPDASDPTEFWSCDARTATVITPVKAYGTTELEARFRLRVAVTRAERGER